MHRFPASHVEIHVVVHPFCSSHCEGSTWEKLPASVRAVPVRFLPSSGVPARVPRVRSSLLPPPRPFGSLWANRCNRPCFTSLFAAASHDLSFPFLDLEGPPTSPTPVCHRVAPTPLPQGRNAPTLPKGRGGSMEEPRVSSLQGGREVGSPSLPMDEWQ